LPKNLMAELFIFSNVLGTWADSLNCAALGVVFQNRQIGYKLSNVKTKNCQRRS
jgi:hypothetical protein